MWEKETNILFYAMWIQGDTTDTIILADVSKR